jgi:hypothetical protein
MLHIFDQNSRSTNLSIPMYNPNQHFLTFKDIVSEPEENNKKESHVTLVFNNGTKKRTTIQLPMELLIEIFLFCDYQTILLDLARVCKVFHSVSKNEYLWEFIQRRTWLSEEIELCYNSKELSAYKLFKYRVYAALIQHKHLKELLLVLKHEVRIMNYEINPFPINAIAMQHGLSPVAILPFDLYFITRGHRFGWILSMLLPIAGSILLPSFMSNQKVNLLSPPKLFFWRAIGAFCGSLVGAVIKHCTYSAYYDERGKYLRREKSFMTGIYTFAGLLWSIYNAYCDYSAYKTESIYYELYLEALNRNREREERRILSIMFDSFFG